jgi:hypothetical protein
MMKKTTPFLFLLLLISLLTACSGSPEATPSEPVLEVINLQISPSLQHWLPKVAACAGDIPDFGITTESLPDSVLELDQTDLIIRLGDRKESDPHVAVLGTEEIVVAISEEMNLSSLSLESLQAIYKGSITNWNDLPELSEEDIESNQPITVLSYPEGDILRQLFEGSYLDGQSFGSQVIPFSTLDFLTGYFEEDPYAISYILKSQVPENTKVLEITGFDQEYALQYVLAVTPADPQGKLLQLLLCIQN